MSKRVRPVYFTLVAEGDYSLHPIIEITTSFTWLGRTVDSDIWLPKGWRESDSREMVDITVAALDQSPRCAQFYAEFEDDERIRSFNFFGKGIELTLANAVDVELRLWIEPFWQAIRKIIASDSGLRNSPESVPIIKSAFFPASGGSGRQVMSRI